MTLALSGADVDRAVLVSLLVMILLLAIMILRQAPKLAVLVVLVGICLVPIWIVAQIGAISVPVASGVCLLAVASLLPVRNFHLSPFDGFVFLLIIIGVASLFIGNSGVAIAALVKIIVYFVVAYSFGRIVLTRIEPRWVYGALAVVMTVVAVLAIVEFATGFNPFVLLRTGNGSYALWGPIQERGGVSRVEASFGHSIALGCSLAMTIPLAFVSRFRQSVKTAMVVTMLGATILTFSRVAIICAALSVVISIAFLRGGLSVTARGILTTVLLVATASIAPFVMTVFDDAGTEASGSAEYRGDLLSLVSRMGFIGVSNAARRASTGELFFGDFRSIDSELILTGLLSGTLALVAGLVALVAAVVLVIRGRATAPTVAVVAQIPALATVALITQYSIAMWVMIGMAASAQLLYRGSNTTIGTPAPVLTVTTSDAMSLSGTLKE